MKHQKRRWWGTFARSDSHPIRHPNINSFSVRRSTHMRKRRRWRGGERKETEPIAVSLCKRKRWKGEKTEATWNWSNEREIRSGVRGTKMCKRSVKELRGCLVDGRREKLVKKRKMAVESCEMGKLFYFFHESGRSSRVSCDSQSPGTLKASTEWSAWWVEVSSCNWDSTDIGIQW